MATKIGALIQAIGERLELDFPGFSVVYGQPSANGVRVYTGNVIRVHYMGERGTYSGSQLGGMVRASPVISVTLQQPYASDSTAVETAQATADLLADLRLSVSALVLEHATTAPIAGMEGVGLWVTDYNATPGILDIGPGQSSESVTVEFSFNYTNTYGGR